MTDDRSRITTDLDTSFMVEAAAGTGKTTSIVSRMVNLVARGTANLNQMAAVTFTRKAAAELRERFQQEIDRRVQSHAEADELQRLKSASTNVGQIFIGTIHSFCAQLIRERPIEFGVHPGFRELEADEHELLQNRAWMENLADLLATNDPLMDQLKAFGLESSQLRECFNNFVEYRDVEEWPTAPTPDFDLTQCQAATRTYIDDMRRLIPEFPAKRGTDTLMAHYEMTVRASAKAFDTEAKFFRLLELIDRTRQCRVTLWHNKSVGQSEERRFATFRTEVAQPALTYWRQRRYQVVVQFVRRALGIYQRLKQFEGALDFTDLLLTAARGLRQHAHLREYYRQRLTHLLVDEFQDTDPIQAEVVILLCEQPDAARPLDAELDWQKCQLRPGSLFVVGDPKQSIYRFRRGDIVTYNRVKSIILASGGQIASLNENYRSSEELLAWNNQLFAERFPQAADDYAPAHTPMACGRPKLTPDDSAGDLAGIFRLMVEGNKRGREQEADQISRFILHAINTRRTIRRWSNEKQCFELSPVTASDFLIITRVKKNVGVYKAALEERGIDCETSGNNSFADCHQLLLLLDVLRAADDPYNPVHYLSLLRERLFGFSDAELYELKKAGGSFVFTLPVPEKLESGLRERFVQCCQQMQQFQTWLRSLPPIVALDKIAEQLGLQADAAACVDGNIALGSLLKAFEVLRTQSHQFDHTADLVESIEQLLTSDEADSLNALHSQRPAVRIMNLHKAKGLEAPIVFLADSAGSANNLPHLHIARSGTRPRGAMCITVSSSSGYQTRPLAEPVDWNNMQAEEQRFLAAEEQRLLYVATTRAGNMLVVTLAGEHAAWSSLGPHLQSAPVLSIPTDDQLADCAMANELPASDDAAAHDIASNNIEATWTKVLEPTYRIINVKKEALRGSRRPDWQSSNEYGVAWGTIIHQLLDLAARSSMVDLRRHAMTLIDEHEMAAHRVDELMETVQAVTASDIWLRSLAASRCFHELPFELIEKRDGQEAVIRGVIDLIFEEPDGWTIVDYKSDNIVADGIEGLCDYYRPQLIEYARYWRSLTGFPVKELGLVITKLRTYRVL